MSRPDTQAELQARIARDYPGLSKRLQQVAQFFLDHPDDIAFGTVAVIAERAQVTPSALVRFANAFGFGGFTEMQQVYRSRLMEAAPSYSERMRIAHERLADAQGADLLSVFTDAHVAALNSLRGQVAADALTQAAELLAATRAVHVVGTRRAYPVAAYLAYTFSHIGRPARLLSAVGGMLREELSLLGAGDVLLAVSFRPYAEETQQAVIAAQKAGLSVIAFTDSPVSPIAGGAAVNFCVADAEVSGFRSLSTSFCLAHALVVTLASRLAEAPADSSNLLRAP